MGAKQKPIRPLEYYKNIRSVNRQMDIHQSRIFEKVDWLGKRKIAEPLSVPPVARAFKKIISDWFLCN
jgi:hypothetical protein